MRAKVKTEFPGRPDRETKTRMVLKGEEITGDLAEVAVRNKWATEIKEAAPKRSRGARSAAKKK